MKVTITDYNDVALEYFNPKLQPQLNAKTECYRAFMKNDRMTHWSPARNWNTALKYGRSNASGFTDGTSLPTEAKQLFKRLQGGSKRWYYYMLIDGLLEVERAKGKRIIVDHLAGEMRGGMEDSIHMLDRKLISGGVLVGFLVQKKNPGGADNWLFYGNFDVVTACVAASATTEARFIRLDRDPTTATTNGYTTVSTTPDIDGVDAAAGTISLDANLNTSGLPTDCVVGVEITDSTAIAALKLDQECVGVYGNLALQTHFTLDRTSGAGTDLIDPVSNDRILQSNFISACTAATAVALDRSHLRKLIVDPYIRTGKYPDQIWMHPLMVEKYEDVLMSSSWAAVNLPGTKASSGDIGFSINDADAEGKTPFSYAGIPIYQKRSVDNGIILAMSLREHNWDIKQSRKFGFETKGGGPLRPVSGKDHFEAFAKMYFELVCQRPAASAVLTGLIKG